MDQMQIISFLHITEEIVQKVESIKNLMNGKNHITYGLGVLATHNIKIPLVLLRHNKNLFK